jgi:superfamily II DNA or RNA helicase
VTELSPGVYETIVSAKLRQRMDQKPPAFVEANEIPASELPSKVSRLVAEFVEDLISRTDDSAKAEVSLAVLRALTALRLEFDDGEIDVIEEPLKELVQVARMAIDGKPAKVARPLIGLSETALLTNSNGEPGLWQQLIAEIHSSDQIDIVMAFVRVSGIRPLLESLRLAVDRGVTVRLITTTYTGSTEKSALDALVAIGVKVKISYDLGSTRLHAKSWYFQRVSGFSTVYVGSSNLTHQAQVTGIEWNIRASGKKDPVLTRKFGAVFESYWASGDYLDYNAEQFEAAMQRQSTESDSEVYLLPGIELRLEPFQERLLELIALSRSKGQHRNLLVSATGTGKTVMAAVDFARLRETKGSLRLLFVAHREEILNQSLAIFRYALSDASFGEKWVGSSKPAQFEHVFASVQTLNNVAIEAIDPTYFDVIIIDEFHHAGAISYQRLLDHFNPVELLGMTATPERADGVSILKWFGGEIAAELRLWDAIDQGRLSPFTYYGIHDGLSLEDIPWKRGLGYDVQSLSNLYTSTDAWARLVIRQTVAHVPNPGTMRGLGFCVSIAHAQFMARHFSQAGFKSIAVHGGTNREEREAALRQLREGEIAFVFSVDVFNEGVDVPSVDTVLLLRPTESATLFLQQLGRGLRRSPKKTVCTVLDFVGSHRAEFRFDQRFGALLGLNRQGLAIAAEQGFPLLPAGCFMHLDQKSQEIILRSLKNAVPSKWRAKVEELRRVAGSGDVMLGEFLLATGLSLSDIYDGVGGHCWSTLREDAGLPVLPSGPNENALRRAIGRMLHVDDLARASRYKDIVTDPYLINNFEQGSHDHRFARMLVSSLMNSVLEANAPLGSAVDIFESHPQVSAELQELFGLLMQGGTHLPLMLRANPHVPLTIHSSYTRVEILAAFGDGSIDSARVPPHQTGVKYVERERADIFFITLDKSSDSFSPTTSYHDYVISSSLFHWESQSQTAQSSATGRRYQNHVAEGSTVHLFLRENTTERSFLYLGTATYVDHVGERPMAITWKLDEPLPGDIYARTSIAIA